MGSSDRYFAAELKNEKARQEGNRLVISFDLDGKEKEAEVNLTITVEDMTYKSSELHIEGDVGKLKTGKGKKVTWNILQDFPKGLRCEAEWELTTIGIVSGLIAYYPFDGNANDKSGNNNHGNVYGARLSLKRSALKFASRISPRSAAG